MVAGARSVAGVLFVLVGLSGLVLPIIPGVPLLVAGVVLLGPQHPLVQPVVGGFRRLRRAWRRRHRPGISSS